MAIDAKRFMPLERLKQNLGEMLGEFTALEPAEGFDRVYYPGEIEGLRREQRRAEGVPIESGLADELAELGKHYNVTSPV